MPSLPRRVWNLGKALAEFTFDGFKTVTRDVYEERLRICDSCNRRDGVWCAHPDCGCNREIKAHGRVWKCPVGKWENVSKPRIAHVMPWDLTTGGAQRMLDLWCALEGDRWETHIFTTGERGPWPFAGATVYAKTTQAKITEWLKALAPDVVVFHDPTTAKHVPASFPQVWVSHCMATLDSAPPDVAPPVCVLSNLDAATHPGWAQIPMRVLPLGVDLQRYREATPQNRSAPICGIVGRLHPDKVPRSFVEALAAWQPGPWHIRFVGHGLDTGYQTQTRKLLQRLPWVEFAGDIAPEKMPDAYHALDALLIPTPLSRGETGSYALVEAMACGLPIVARDLEGLRFNGGDAPLFAKGDSELLARLRELDDPARRQALGRRGREIAERDHDLRRHVVAHSRAFADALRVDVSILMTTYNTPSVFLREAWDSITAQTFRHWELVLVDDGSTAAETIAETDRIARDPRVRLLRLPANGGLARALNAGLDVCRAELVARMDADDRMTPDRLAKQVVYMQGHSDVAILGAQLQPFDETGKSSRPTTRHPAVVTRGLIERQRAEHRIWFLNHPTVIFRRSLIRGLGGYPNYRVAQDLAMWLRAFRAGLAIHNLPEVLLHYRLHPGQLTAVAGREDEYTKIVETEWENDMDPYATHQQMLVFAAAHTTGPILELGAGDYSTPLLHAMSCGARQIITLESDADWLKRFAAFAAPWHEFRHVADWRQAIAEALKTAGWFGLAFVDQRPSTERGKAIRQIHYNVELIVAHDTQNHHGPEFAGALEEFRFSVEDRRAVPYTAAVSDVMDVRAWREVIPGSV